VSTTDSRPAPANDEQLIVRGLALGLRDQAERIRLCAATEPHRAFGVIADAHSTLRMLEQYVLGVLAESADDDNAEPTSDDRPGMYL
jgi:hypothetical protein